MPVFFCITDVYLSLNNIIIPNHGYVVINDIGFTNDAALICHTNRPPPDNAGNSGGDWYAPDGTRVHYDDVPGFRRNRAPMIVRLYRNTATDPPSEGIYHCQIEDDTLTTRNQYAGLFNGEGGEYYLNIINHV